MGYTEFDNFGIKMAKIYFFHFFTPKIFSFPLLPPPPPPCWCQDSMPGKRCDNSLAYFEQLASHGYCMIQIGLV